MDKQDIAAYVRGKRLAKGLTQEQLALRMGGCCRVKDISRWENGARFPNFKNWEKLQEILGE